VTTAADISRRINAERIVLLGWLRAVLLQLAHPLIAAGVAEHSSFRGGTGGTALSRLHHTVAAMLALTFGDDRQQEEVLDAIRAIHRRVHGSLPAACGPFPAGTPYSAEDPALVLWVHATLIDSIVRVYEQLVRSMTDAERDAFCADSASVAIALGARNVDVPRRWPQLQEYLHTTYTSGVITPGDQARMLAAALLSPIRGLAAAPVGAILSLLAAGLLPPTVRRGYGFEWSRDRERAFRTVTAMLRLARRVTPQLIRWWPEARMRVSARPGAE
jgi:uncharacterized protein (DUF2236 family)